MGLNVLMLFHPGTKHIPSACFLFSTILQGCGKPLAGRARDQRAPPATPVPAGASTEENQGSRLPLRHCGAALGWGHGAPHPGHSTWRRSGTQDGHPCGGSAPLAGGTIARAHTHTHTERRAGRGARRRERRALYLFCQPWRRLVYLLSTPSSAGSLLRPPPPDGLAATEPGLLRLPPPPSPAPADRLETPRPAREQEGEEPAEVARLLLRLLLLLPPPPSAPWAALSMVRARPGRGCPPRRRPRLWGS